MKLEILDNKSYINLYCASRLSLEAKSVCRGHKHVLKFKLWLCPKDLCGKSLPEALGLGSPALDLKSVLPRGEGNSSDSIAGDRIAAVIVYLPDLNKKLGPTTHSLSFVVHIKGVVPDKLLISLVFDLFISLTSIFTREESPVVAHSYIKL
jgi:hypothetical protein